MILRPSVQAIIVDEKTNKLLLIKQLDLVKKKYLWRLVKGGVEKDETEEQALKREIREEVGLKNIEIVGKIYKYEYVFDPKKFVVSTYLVNGNMNEKIALENHENGDRIIDFKWVSREQALEMLYWENEKEAVKLLK